MLMVAGAAGFFWWKSQGRTVRAQEATKEARAQRARAEEQFLAASVNLARAHEEKAVGIVSQPEDKCSTSDYQGALLQALQSQRWVPPNPGLGSPVYALAFSPDGRLFASATGNTVRLWDRRAAWLLIDNAAPSPRAALMSEVLQRRWGLRFNRLDLVPEAWNWPLPATATIRLKRSLSTSAPCWARRPSSRTSWTDSWIGSRSRSRASGPEARPGGSRRSDFSPTGPGRRPQAPRSG